MKKTKIALTILTAALLAGCSTTSESVRSAKSESELFEFSGNQSYVSAHNANPADAKNQAEGLKSEWWKESSFYHIWVKSFSDSDGDGCGDINGITQNLPYIQETLGCDGIWLSPIFDCAGKGTSASTNMHGYDTVDYYSLNKLFGSEADLDNLIAECHKRGMQLIFDFVPNHTSSEHPWFKDSQKGGQYRDWYMWSASKLSWTPMGNPNTWFENKGSYYYGAFGGGMPDLNYRNYEVREEMKNVVRYWLNRGFDGLRIDAAIYLVEEQGKYGNTAETHKWFKELRAELDKYESPKFMISETWIVNDRSSLDEYLGNGTEFHAVFDFDQGTPVIDSISRSKDSLASSIRANPASNQGYGTFLGNHDEYAGRFATTFGSDRKKINLATALSLLRPTIPFIYYGNEIGQKESSMGGDLRLRGPFLWDMAEEEKSQFNSTLNLNHTILSLRKKYPSIFTAGKVNKLASKLNSLVAYELSGSDGSILCVYNLSDSAVASASFTGVAQTSSLSLLMGDSEAPLPTFSGNSVTVQNLAPYAFRVYFLGKSGLQNLYDDEEFVSSEKYVAANDKSPVYIPAESMYLRGSMNGWGGTKMRRTVDKKTGDVIWMCNYTFDAAQNIEFKFCINDGPVWGANWGTATGANLSCSVDKGTYLFQFNETKQTNSVSRQ
ncbi:alpha-amylase family glycosyl hydrolase [uncultured Treponema sp.]|uniref:alpha-amylase family glycosyl hydrolase n=1 Tax=uncultured Treponema sp. TaxID=162155 RepID=UPI0025E490E8|nr:alpha-amylase family glycosyl hydrolase [uncultured Treponema sp.]